MVEKHNLQDRVVAIITDTPSTMKSLWRKLLRKYRKLIALGCGAHILQLFLTGEEQ